jgi:hypothetical protein
MKTNMSDRFSAPCTCSSLDRPGDYKNVSQIDQLSVRLHVEYLLISKRLSDATIC